MGKIIHLVLKKELEGAKYWDQTFLNDILAEIDMSKSDRDVIIIPGAYQYDIIFEINKELAKYKKIMVFVMSDEENKLKVEDLSHPDMILYSQYLNGGLPFPTGYPPNTREILEAIGYVEKEMDWFFSGQVNNYRRERLVEVLRMMDNGFLQENEGFGKGMAHAAYLNMLSRAKVVPCPSGNIVPDSFRFYETLEAGGIPIADDQSPLKSVRENFWGRMFGEVPFPTYTNEKEFRATMKMGTRDPDFGSRIFAWWINAKYRIKEEIKRELGFPEEEIVAIIPVSPISAHPDTSMLKETIESIRHHLDCPIIVTIDGIREEQEHYRADYREFIKRFLWECNFEYKNVLPVIFDKHVHQSGMMGAILTNVETPMFLYVEHDTPLVTDMDIDWEKCKEFIRSGKSNVIRFHFEAQIPEPHEYLMIGKPEDGFQKTVQWSQRPHLASRNIYQVIMNIFTKDSNCFIEDKIHGVVQDLWNEKGMEGWDKWKVHIYHPEGNIKRSYNLDGRKDDKKFVEEQVW